MSAVDVPTTNQLPFFGPHDGGRETPMNDYLTSDGNPVPDDVADVLAPVDSDVWDSRGIRPDGITVYRHCGDAHYHGYDSDGREVYVTERGYPSRTSHFDYVTRLSDGALPHDSPATYHSGNNIVHHDHYAEHVTRAIVVVAPDTRFVMGSRSGILWHEPHKGDVGTFDVSDEAFRLCVSLLDTGSPLAHDPDESSVIPDRPDGYEQPLSGWHSSMESSEQSDMMNALAAGDLPPAFMDENSPFPYAVRYGDTRNVCATNASVYAPSQAADRFRDLFDGARAKPAYSGF